MWKRNVDAMLVLRNLLEKSDAKGKDHELWLMFIDYAKALDTVKHHALWETLLELRVPKHLVWLIRQLCLKAVGMVRVGESINNICPFEKGVRQGCLLSPMMFSAVGGKMMRLVVDETSEGIGCIMLVETSGIYALPMIGTTLIPKSRTELEDVSCSVEHHSKVTLLTVRPANPRSPNKHQNHRIRT